MENELEKLKADSNQAEVNKNIDKPSSEKKKRKKFNINNLTKKQKIIFIVIIILMIGLIIFLTWFFLFKEDEQETVLKESEVIEKNNYIYDNGKLIFIDKNDKEIGYYDCKNKDENKCKLAMYTQEENLASTKYIDEAGAIISFNTPIFAENYVFVNDNEKEEDITIILYDLKEKKEVQQYKSIKRYDNNRVLVQNDEDMYGVIQFENNSVETIVDFNYDYLGKMEEVENVAYKKDNYHGLLDDNGKEIVSKVSEPILSYNDTKIAIGSNNSYQLIDYQKNKLNDKNFSYINMDNNYIYLFENDGLYLIDNELAKLNEAKIEVDNTNGYMNTVILDENFSKIDSTDIFTLDSSSEGTLTINAKNKETTINLYEVALNKNYNFVNYLNGFIYIYDDEKKINVSSSYDCDNENEVTKDTNAFTSCFVAKESKTLNRENTKDTLGFIPIYNDKYIFIQDKANLATSNNIILFDYTTNKEVAKYDIVDVGYYNDTNNIVKANADNLVIMASNTNKKYGLIKMNNDAVSSLLIGDNINFQYKSIIYFKDAILAVKDDNSQFLFDKNGKLLTSADATIKNEIVDYIAGYLTVKDGNNFLIYSMNGNIISNPAEEIKLGHSIFAALNNKEIDVYRYTDGKTSLLTNTIDFNGKSFELSDNGSSGFTITIKDSNDKVVDTYVYDIYGNQMP